MNKKTNENKSHMGICIIIKEKSQSARQRTTGGSHAGVSERASRRRRPSQATTGGTAEAQAEALVAGCPPPIPGDCCVRRVMLPPKDPAQTPPSMDLEAFLAPPSSGSQLRAPGLQIFSVSHGPSPAAAPGVFALQPYGHFTLWLSLNIHPCSPCISWAGSPSCLSPWRRAPLMDAWFV